jgi:hypothetical protein
MFRINLTHSYQAQIGEVRIPIGVALCKRCELDDMIAAVKRERNQALAQDREDDGHALQVKRRLGQYRFTSEQGLGHLLGDLHRPLVIVIVAVRERDQQSGIGNAYQGRENPFRFDRSRAPRIVPAKRMNDCSERLARARSSCSRIIRPRGIPDLLETCSNQAASSSVRRAVTA